MTTSQQTVNPQEAGRAEAHSSLFLTRAQYDTLQKRDVTLLAELIIHSPNRRWSLAGCRYVHVPDEVAERVRMALEPQLDGGKGDA